MHYPKLHSAAILYLYALAFVCFTVADNRRIPHMGDKMKIMQVLKVCVIIVSISGLLVVYFKLPRQQSTSGKGVSSKRLRSPIDAVDLKLFEQEIRNKFSSLLPKLSTLENSQYDICVRNLEKKRTEDRKKIFQKPSTK